MGTAREEFDLRIRLPAVGLERQGQFPVSLMQSGLGSLGSGGAEREGDKK